MQFRQSKLENPPHQRNNIWRYMPLEKFIDLITSHTLYFPNAKSFSDQYEVSIPSGLKYRFLKSHSEEEYLDKAKKIDSVRSRLFLNCWSIQTNESYALWKIYLGGAKAGVAIKSNVSKMKKTIINENQNNNLNDFYIERVQYEKSGVLFKELNVRNIAATKTSFYEYEEELRLFYLSDECDSDTDTSETLQDGFRVSVNPDELIDSIYLSPFCGSWFREAFLKLLKKTHPALGDRVKLSEIMDQ